MNCGQEEVAHILFALEDVKHGLPREHLNGKNAHRPCIQRLCGNQTSLPSLVCVNHFRGSVAQSETGGRFLIGSRHASEIDESPALLAGQPQHVAGLDITMHKASRMQVLQPVCQVR